MKLLLAIAALAAALSTAAFAADVKSTQPTPMTDAQMDAVTAGNGPPLGAGPGIGLTTAASVAPNTPPGINGVNNAAAAGASPPSGFSPGFGKLTGCGSFTNCGQ
jgi:opacity protein-like surface antigen